MNCAAMKPRQIIIFLLTVVFIIKIDSSAILKWSDLNCQVLEGGKNYMDFEYCYLKAVRRDYAEANIKVIFLQLPITNVVGKIQSLKRANGYKPFLYNIKFDCCKLANNDKYHMSLEKLLYDLIKKSMKEKLVCPWNSSSVTVDHFGLEVEKFQLPLPTGVYRGDVIFLTDGIPRIGINFTMTNQEY